MRIKHQQIKTLFLLILLFHKRRIRFHQNGDFVFSRGSRRRFELGVLREQNSNRREPGKFSAGENYAVSQKHKIVVVSIGMVGI